MRLARCLPQNIPCIDAEPAWRSSLEGQIEALGLRTLVTDTIMVDDAGRARLAETVLEFARSL